METKITRQSLFGRDIWTVSFYSPLSKAWVISGQFDAHTEAVAEARSWR